MNSKVFFCVILSAISFCLQAGYVVVGSTSLGVDHEIMLPENYGNKPITAGCFGQTGSCLALAADKAVILYLMGNKKEDNGTFVRAPGRFLNRFHFPFSIFSVSVDESNTTFYVSNENSIVSKVNWITGKQQNIEVSSQLPPLRLSPFNESYVAISGGNASVIYSRISNSVVLRKEHESPKNYNPFFAWEIEGKRPAARFFAHRVDYVPCGFLCANCPSVQYPIVKTRKNAQEEPILILVDQKNTESYRPLSGVATSLVRNPADSNIVVVGYESGDIEIMDLTLPSATWKYKNVHPPLIFNSYGTQLIGTRKQKLVMISVSQSEEEASFMEQAMVLASIKVVEEKSLLNSLRKGFKKLEAIEKDAPKKKKKIGNRKKKKYGRKNKK